MSKVGRAAVVALVAVFGVVPASKGTTHRGVGGSGDGRAKGGRSLGARVTQQYSQLPISFEPNRGQTDPRVNFLARGTGYGLFLGPTEATLVLSPSRTGARGPPHGPRNR